MRRLLHDAYIELICDCRKNEKIRIHPNFPFTYSYAIQDYKSMAVDVVDKKGKVIDINRNNFYVVVDMSIEYKSIITKYDICTFISQYFDNYILDIQGTIPNEILSHRITVVDNDKWCIYDDQYDSIFREGDIVNIGARNGRLFDIHFENDVLSYKVDCSTQGHSDVLIFSNVGSVETDEHGLLRIWDDHLYRFKKAESQD